MRSIKEIKEEMRKVRRAMKMHEVRLQRSRERYDELQLELAETERKEKSKCPDMR